MPFPMALARFNKRYTNRIVVRFAGRMAPLANVVHRGRRSGAEYRTPVLAFPGDDRFTVALTYGAGVDWVRNVLAAGGCALEYRGGRHLLAEPSLIDRTAARTAIPAWFRAMLSLLRVTDYLALKQVAAGAADGGG